LLNSRERKENKPRRKLMMPLKNTMLVQMRKLVLIKEATRSSKDKVVMILLLRITRREERLVIPSLREGSLGQMIRNLEVLSHLTLRKMEKLLNEANSPN